jgi:RimJ/RimL family protein N-acetyltransferase
MISGQAVSLTELREGDRDALFRWINDPDVVHFNAPYSPVHSPNHAQWFENLAKDKSRIIFAIRTADSAKLVGTIQLADIHPIHRSAELIIRIGTEANRGIGLGSEAVKLLVQFGFQHRNLLRIWLRVFADNVRAIRSYEKAGLVREGVQRRACFINGRWRDLVMMAVLRENLETNGPSVG